MCQIIAGMFGSIGFARSESLSRSFGLLFGNLPQLRSSMFVMYQTGFFDGIYCDMTQRLHSAACRAAQASRLVYRSHRKSHMGHESHNRLLSCEGRSP